SFSASRRDFKMRRSRAAYMDQVLLFLQEIQEPSQVIQHWLSSSISTKRFVNLRSPTTMKLPSPSPIGMTSEWAREFFETISLFYPRPLCGRGKGRVLRVFHKHTPAQLGLDSSTPCWNDEQRRL